MSNPASTSSWRWTALCLVIINAAHGFFLHKLHPSLPDVAEISERHQNLFTPAGYAFSIWGLIYAGFAAFCVYTLLPSQRTQPSHDFLVRSLAACALMGMAWEEAFIREKIGLSVSVIFCMFALGALMFGRAKNNIWRGVGRAPLYSPFSLFFGWISVATLANVAGWLKSMGWDGGSWGEVPWTVILIGTSLVAGIVVSRRWRDSIYPLVILWSLVAIWERQRNTGTLVEYSALGAAMLMTLWTLINAGWIRTHSTILRQQINPPAPVYSPASHDHWQNSNH